MEVAEFKTLLSQAIPGTIYCDSHDGRHFEAVVISDTFADLSKVKRQQAVYTALGDVFSTGAVHALSLKTYTPEEWAIYQEQRK